MVDGVKLTFTEPLRRSLEGCKLQCRGEMARQSMEGRLVHSLSLCASVWWCRCEGWAGGKCGGDG